MGCGLMRRAAFGVFVSMIIGGFCFIIVFGEFIAILLAVYAFPFLIFYGLPVAWMAHQLTHDDLEWPALKRLLVYIVMGGWLPIFIGLIVYLNNEPYDASVLIVIILSMVFACGFWMGEEFFDRTKLNECTEPNLMKV